MLLALSPCSAGLAAEPAPAAAAPMTLDGLLGAFRGMSGFSASFVEDKHLALLAAPLTSRGKLYFAPPGHLARHVEAPQRSIVVITPDTVRMTDATGTETIDLRARPDVKTFVESFLRILAGDRAGLERVYHLTFAYAEDGWLLTMTPRGEPLSQLISDLQVRGDGLAVRTIRVSERSGDHSLITIADADPHHTFSAEDKLRLFGAPDRKASP